MPIKINYLNAEISISNTEEISSFLLSEIHEELIDLHYDFFKKIDQEHYLNYEFHDLEFANPIDVEGGFIDEPLQVNIDLLKITFSENLLEITFNTEIHFEVFFDIRGKIYDGVDKCWEYHGGSLEKHFQEKITYKGIVKKDLSSNNNFHLIVDNQDIIYPQLNNYVKTTEMFEVDNQYLLRLITNSTFCPFDYFEKNMEMIQSELITSDNAPVTFNKLIMLHAHIISCFEAYLLVRLCSLVLTIPKLKQKLEANKKEFQHLKNIEKIVDKSFHNIDFIEKLLNIIFGIDISDRTTKLKEAVEIRHDCIHRAGRDSNQQLISISHDSALELHSFITNTARTLDERLAYLFK